MRLITETSNEHRQSRVTGRIVKIYSGTRPDPVTCAGEGFQADPHNCAIFYRCMKSGNGKYSVFKVRRTVTLCNRFIILSVCFFSLFFH